MSAPYCIFITGTDTDVGKTYVTSRMARDQSLLGQRVGVYKPVASGCEIVDGEMVPDDAVKLWQAAGRPLSLDAVCPQKFVAPVSPPAAAQTEGKTVDERRLLDGLTPWLCDNFDVVLIEGAGGLFSPVSESMLNIDLLKRISPDEVVLVSANRLGVLHQTIATCEAARARGVTVHRIVLSHVTKEADASVHTNADEIRRFTGVHDVQQVGFGD